MNHLKNYQRNMKKRKKMMKIQSIECSLFHLHSENKKEILINLEAI